MKRKYKQLCLLLSTLIMGIGMVTVSFSKNENSESLETFQSKTVPEVETITEDAPTQALTQVPVKPSIPPKEPEDPTKIKKTTDASIVKLIESYYQAKLNCDEDQLQSLITDATVLDINVISRKMEYINGFHNFVCFVKPGIKDGDYVLYVTYDMEIVSIETYAPSIDEFYLTTVKDKLLIKVGNFSDDIVKLINTYHESEDVKSLVNDVRQRLIQARQSDGMLNQFYENLLDQIEQKKSKEE